MINFNVPGEGEFQIKNVVFDFNGTIAKDGLVLEDFKVKVEELSKKDVNIFVVTADTYGSVREQCKDLPLQIKVFDKDNAAVDKKRIVQMLSSKNTVTIGNGNNDALMFKESVLSICIIGHEGCSTKALLNSDIVVNNIIDAIDLLLNVNRLKATLRG